MDVYSELGGLVRGEVRRDKKTLRKYSKDASLFQIWPKAVVFPRDADDIKALVKFVAKHKERHPDLSLTVRSGGTDMTGGPLGESIILDVNKHLNRFRKMGKDYATAEPGMFYRNFEKETMKKGLIMPSYPASREICTIGGMVANNAGGEKTLTYGKTEDYIKEVKMVLRDGEEYSFRPISKKELSKKLKLNTLEGEVYRKVFNIVNKNYDKVKSAKPKVSKNSAGYYLWNVWNRKEFDMPKLIVGSQGTLGIITEVTFRLVKLKKHSTLLVIFVDELETLADVVKEVLRHKPESFESYDDRTLKIALKFLPSMIKLIGARNLISLGFQFLPEFWMAVTGGMPKLFLEAEFTGNSEKEIYVKAYEAEESVRKMGLRTRVTKSDQEEKKYWTVRRESFNLLRHHVQGKRTAPFIDDVVVRPGKLPEFLPKLAKVMAEYDLVYTIAGHIGNGNFHIIPLMAIGDPNAKKIIPELAGKVYRVVFEFGGSMTAEHNDGLIRGPYLRDMYGSGIYKLFERTKKAFDPDGIFNPGKKVGGDLKYSIDHIAL